MAETGYTLVIGDKNFSSWSLRPWLAMKAAGIPFAEEHVRLRQPETKQAILRHSPSGKVPALKAGGEVIWDGLAILEFLAERHSEKRLWPEDPAARAAARSISAEMHAGFATLRNEMPMDLLARLPSPHIGDARLPPTSGVSSRSGGGGRARFGAGGPHLFGAFTNADAMFAPVATRFRTYAVDLAAFGDDGTASAYADAILAMPAIAAWTDGAEAELRGRKAEARG